MHIFFFLFFSLTLVQAQTYEEFLRAQNEAFSSYKEERDKEFSDYLNKEWKAYKESMGVKAYEKQKPSTLPQAEKLLSQEPIKKVLVRKQPPIIKTEKRYNKIIIQPKSEELKRVFLNFFGVDVTVHFDTSMMISLQRGVSKVKIAQAWKGLASSEYKNTIDELNSIAAKLQLNDWARYLLVKQTAGAIYKDENEARVFTWFTLLKMGYDARLSFQEHRVILLVPVEGELYNTVYYTLNNKKYYAIDYYAKGKLGPVVTYENEYKGANAAIDFLVDRLPLLVQSRVVKRFGFNVDNMHRPVVLEYDKNLFDFYQSYPQVGYQNYFFAPESILLDESIKKAFEPLILGKSQSEALDIVLSFVQHAFRYQVDTEQFSVEKVMFPSETIFYTYSDCEDRAILFSYMVKLLFGMDVLGLKYPNHMATAVQIDEKLEGEYVVYKDKPYIVADPTYVNAKIGLSMPQYRGRSSYEIVARGSEK